MIGTQIENYQIQAKLGEGGMGVVYKALDVNLDRIVALKVLKAPMAEEANLLDRFRSEARAQATLTHPNVATLYNFFVHQNQPVMVMEFVDGETLQRVVERRGPIPATEAVALFRQVLLGAEAAHQFGIIHRDIKPSNLMLNRAGVVKVMDFGVAKVTDPQQTLTRSGVRVGTAYYMSPEQVKGEPVDIRTDIYALGITLYELLTAHVPFFGDSEFQILSDHVHRIPPPPSTYLPQLPKDLESIVLKALEKNPGNRFQTVGEFCAALDKAALIPPTVVHPAPVTWSAAPPNVPPTGSKLPLGKLAAAAVLLVCALSVAGFVRFKKTPEPTQPAAVKSEPVPVSQTTIEIPTPSPEDKASAKSAAPAEKPNAPKLEARSLPRKMATEAQSTIPPVTSASATALVRAPVEALQAPAPPPEAPAVSQAAVDEAAHRLARLRSRASSLHANLDDLRHNLAAQGLSIRGEATEAASNLDLYLQEADRALQGGDVASAVSNMDRADHEAKKLAGITGG